MAPPGKGWKLIRGIADDRMAERDKSCTHTDVWGIDTRTHASQDDEEESDVGHTTRVRLRNSPAVWSCSDSLRAERWRRCRASRETNGVAEARQR